MRRFKSNKGYFKFFNKEGQECRIKCDREINGNVIIKYLKKDEVVWRWLTPEKEFISSIHTINYILKHLESDKSIFEIIPVTKFQIKDIK